MQPGHRVPPSWVNAAVACGSSSRSCVRLRFTVKSEYSGRITAFKMLLRESPVGQEMLSQGRRITKVWPGVPAGLSTRAGAAGLDFPQVLLAPWPKCSRREWVWGSDFSS